MTLFRTSDVELPPLSPVPYWLDTPDRPEPLPALTAEEHAGLVVVGGGYQGLWTALKAKERNPSRDVVLLEANRVGGAASGRNGGFVSASLTHGISNGHSRWPRETSRVEQAGLANLAGLEKDLKTYGIECEFERTGKLAVATSAHGLEELEHTRRLLNAHGHQVASLDQDQVAQRIVSPTFVGGTFEPEAALVNPAQLAFGLRAACLRLGVRIYEGTPAIALKRAGSRVKVVAPQGVVHADKAVLATSAFPSLIRRVRFFSVPVYDYALVTEPLSVEQRQRIGWAGREGVTDTGNQFHYFRLTADNRILWGGYDAIYHFGNRVDDSLDQRPATFALLMTQFAETFPALADVRFTHAWGGLIDTCSRFFAFYGTAMGGRVAYGLGHTGLGVAATRFAAETVLDMVDGLQTERTRLSMVKRKPIPFPPEPMRWIGIQITRRALVRSDRTGGRRGFWLWLLDHLGVGFDS